MRVLCTVLLALVVAPDAPTTAPVTQTDNEVRINTPQLELMIPGHWKEQKAPSRNAIYSAMNPASDRQINVSVYLLERGLTAEQRRKAFNELFDARVGAERELAKGQANVRPTDITEQDGLLIADYLVTHPAGGRVAFCHMVCDQQKAASVYWEVLQLQAAPDLKALLGEFSRISDSLKLK